MGVVELERGFAVKQRQVVSLRHFALFWGQSIGNGCGPENRWLHVNKEARRVCKGNREAREKDRKRFLANCWNLH